MKSRDIGIDIIKFIAAIIITNSHFGNIYPSSLQPLATGGAIGDALFFFCSGFTLFLKPIGRFDNWYKKRISRIYPTIFAWAIISSFLFGSTSNMKHTILHGGGWFVTCIMLYYIVAYFIDRYFYNRLYTAFSIATLIVIISYIMWDRPDDFGMYGATRLKWVFFFLAMLLGAIIGKSRKIMGEKKSLIISVASIIAFYAILFMSASKPIANKLQIISLVPLLALTYSTYSLFNGKTALKLFCSKSVYFIVMFVGGLCLEIYITQITLLRYDLGLPFPVSYFAMFAIIIISAYLLRCCARCLMQTFNKQDYNWKEIFKAI